MKKLNIILSFCLIICSVFAFASCTDSNIDSAKATAFMDKGIEYVDQSLENESRLLELLNQSANGNNEQKVIYGHEANKEVIRILSKGMAELSYRNITTEIYSYKVDGGEPVLLNTPKYESYDKYSTYVDLDGNCYTYSYDRDGEVYTEAILNENGIYDVYKYVVAEDEKICYVQENSRTPYYLDEKGTGNCNNVLSWVVNIELNGLFVSEGVDEEDAYIEYTLTQVAPNKYEYTIFTSYGIDIPTWFIYKVTIENNLAIKLETLEMNYNSGCNYFRNIATYNYSNDPIAFDKTGYTIVSYGYSEEVGAVIAQWMEENNITEVFPYFGEYEYSANSGVEDGVNYLGIQVDLGNEYGTEDLIDAFGDLLTNGYGFTNIDDYFYISPQQTYVIGFVESEVVALTYADYIASQD